MDDISWVNAASMSKEGGTACDDDATAGGGTGGGWGTPPWASCRNYALDFMSVCMPLWVLKVLTSTQIVCIIVYVQVWGWIHRELCCGN
jgi:hypothetical protein